MLTPLSAPVNQPNPLLGNLSASPLGQGQQVNPLAQDGFNPSDALKDPNNPAANAGGAMMAQSLAGSLYDGMLKGQAQQVLVAAMTGQGDVQAMGTQLMEAYKRAKEMGAVLSPQTEQLVQMALQLVQPQQQGQQGGDAGGGAPQGGAPPVGAPQGGGAPQSGGGAPQSGGGAPQSGGGAPQTGGGAPQTGGGAPQTGEAPLASAPETPSRNTPQSSEVAPPVAAPRPEPAPQTPPETPPAPVPATQGPSATTTTPIEETRRIGKMEDRLVQGSAQNCGATSIINGMMQMEQSQEGWGQGMKIEPQPDGTTKVTMRDGYETTLTPEQLAQTAKATGYTGDPAAVDRANTYMGAAANRYAQENGTNFTDGLNNLNTNNWPGTTRSGTPGVDKYFGVQAAPIQNLETLDRQGVAIVANSTHTDVARTSKNDGKTYLGDHGSRNNGHAREYDGNIYSNGKSTGPATEAWTLQPAPKYNPTTPPAATTPAPAPEGSIQQVNYTTPRNSTVTPAVYYAKESKSEPVLLAANTSSSESKPASTGSKPASTGSKPASTGTKPSSTTKPASTTKPKTVTV